MSCTMLGVKLRVWGWEGMADAHRPHAVEVNSIFCAKTYCTQQKVLKKLTTENGQLGMEKLCYLTFEFQEHW